MLYVQNKKKRDKKSIFVSFVDKKRVGKTWLRRTALSQHKKCKDSLTTPNNVTNRVEYEKVRKV